MRVRVLGCSGAIAKGCRTTSFLIDSDLLVDAGTGVGDLTLDEMLAVDDVLLTHSHLDHFASLPLMVDSVSGLRESPLRVHALRPTIEALRTHVFNDVIWPDFANIPSRDAPLLSFHAFEIGDVLHLGTQDAKAIEVLSAVHTVPACGFAVRSVHGLQHWVFSGDTERNPPFWQRVNQIAVGALTIETAFGNEDTELAYRARHLVPDTLVSELAQLAPSSQFPIYISHTKPADTHRIVDQVCNLIGSESMMHGAAARTNGSLSRHPVIQWQRAGDVMEI